jgi:hypothetical protein
MSNADPWWRSAPHYEELAAQLDPVPAIDVHTHLGRPLALRTQFDSLSPLRLRSSEPSYAAALTARFGVEVGDGGLAEAMRRAGIVRDEMVERQGLTGYLHDHLDFTNTELALVNQALPEGTDGRRLRWVPYGSTFLYPLPANSLVTRSPLDRENIESSQSDLRRFLRDDGSEELPGNLDGYLALIGRSLERWRGQGAVALKFDDAYLRTLLFSEVPRDEAARLYRDGRQTPLSRDQYLALQDHLARFIFTEGPRHKFAIHIHTGPGGSPFLQLREADVRNLEPVLTDPQFSDTQFVLIHGGGPQAQYEEAAYLTTKPHVWADTSAMPFVYEVPELARVIRGFLRQAPEKLLFGTDVQPTPVGPEIQHVALTRHLREGLNLALARMVHDRLVDLDWAVSIGNGVLHENARRLLA